MLQQQWRSVATPVEGGNPKAVVLDRDRAGIGHGGARYLRPY
jgi:hypothetical protein